MKTDLSTTSISVDFNATQEQSTLGRRSELAKLPMMVSPSEKYLSRNLQAAASAERFTLPD